MRKTVLIAPLGTVPAVITSTVQALSADRDGATTLKPDAVYTISTSDTEIQSKVLEKYFERLHIEYKRFWIAASDIESTQDADLFRQLIERVFAEEVDADDRVIVGVTGGRKAMSALVSVTAQLHNIFKLYNLWAHDDLENDRTTANHLLDELNSGRVPGTLTPPADKYRLIELPLLPLFDLRETMEASDTL